MSAFEPDTFKVGDLARVLYVSELVGKIGHVVDVCVDDETVYVWCRLEFPTISIDRKFWSVQLEHVDIIAALSEIAG